MTPPVSSPWALAGSMLLLFAMGPLHAFSVLLHSIETEFGSSRAAAGLTYSIALVSVAAAVLVGHRIYERLSPATNAVLFGVIAASGCLLAAYASHVVYVWLGYGVIFGGANGLAYGYGLQLSSRSYPGAPGTAMGLATGAYALGAVVSPIPLQRAADAHGWSGAVLALAAAVMAISGLAAVALARSDVSYPQRQGVRSRVGPGIGREVLGVWICYFLVVVAGLMVIGHATGIAEAGLAGSASVVAAPIVVAAANLAGSLVGGILIDRVGGRRALASLATVSAAGLTMLVFAPLATTIGLAVVGLAYGGSIAGYPAYVATRFGPVSEAVYGRVFTAWAVAGLVGPSLAGRLFDRDQNYRVALLLAAMASVASAGLAATGLRERQPLARAQPTTRTSQP